jgi:uncharacterized SAM-binding protein YcdF (DUF218 family)
VRLLWKLLRLLLVIVILGLAVYFASPLVLAAAGRYLVTAHPPQKGDLAVVLAGQPFLRVPEAARLYHEGLVPAILLSVPPRPPGLDSLRRLGIRYPDEQETALGILEALRVPRRAVSVLDGHPEGVWAEMESVARFLKAHPARSLVVVTSKSRSTRSHRIFRDGLPGIAVRAHPVPDDPFDPAAWWKRRTHVHQVVQEYLGLVDYLRLRFWTAVLGWTGFPAAGTLRVAALRG